MQSAHTPWDKARYMLPYSDRQYITVRTLPWCRHRAGAVLGTHSLSSSRHCRPECACSFNDVGHALQQQNRLPCDSHATIVSCVIAMDLTCRAAGVPRAQGGGGALLREPGLRDCRRAKGTADFLQEITSKKDQRVRGSCMSPVN